MMFDGKVKGIRQVSLNSRKPKSKEDANKDIVELAKKQREIRAIERLKYNASIKIQ